MNSIYKFPLNINASIEIDMPAGAQILTIETQNNEPQMWALVETLEDPEIRFFKVVSTGDPIDCEGELVYLGSFIIDDGLIRHVFEEIALVDEFQE